MTLLCFPAADGGECEGYNNDLHHARQQNDHRWLCVNCELDVTALVLSQMPLEVFNTEVA